MATPAEFMEVLKAGDAEKVAAMLAAEPALAGARDAAGRSALFMAAVRSREDLIAALMAAGAAPDLMDCCAIGDIDRAKAWIEKDKAKALAHWENGFTPLHMAAYFGNAKIARVLLMNGAEIESVTKNKLASTPLQIAATKGALAVIELLLSSGADVESRKSENKSPPLVMAVQSGSAGAVTLLLDGGANPSAADGAGKTALAFAKEAGSAKLVELLQSRGAS